MTRHGRTVQPIDLQGEPVRIGLLSDLPGISAYLFRALSTAFAIAVLFWTVTAVRRRRPAFVTRAGIVIVMWAVSIATAAGAHTLDVGRYLIPRSADGGPHAVPFRRRTGRNDRMSAERLIAPFASSHAQNGRGIPGPNGQPTEIPYLVFVRLAHDWRFVGAVLFVFFLVLFVFIRISGRRRVAHDHEELGLQPIKLVGNSSGMCWVMLLLLGCGPWGIVPLCSGFRMRVSAAPFAGHASGGPPAAAHVRDAEPRRGHLGCAAKADDLQLKLERRDIVYVSADDIYLLYHR